MKERRLLERIAYWGEDGGQQRSHQTQVDILMQSVMAHLARLLNTRRGSVQLDPLFGVPDFTNLAGGTGVGSARDIQEEIDRLRAHIAGARALLAGTGAVGRRLDFLAQEFNREANTLCSKSNAVELTAIGLDLKAVIDQLREQVQNIE